jgi:hypothetical protein
MKGGKYVIPDDQGWLNVLFNINQSVSHHNIMLLLPYVSQLSYVTSQLKDIYGLGAQLLVMIMMTCADVVLTSQKIFLFYIEVEYLQ